MPQIHTATTGELADIRAIWEDKFPAEEEYQQTMFSKIIPLCTNYIVKNEDGTVISVVSLMPMKFINEEKGIILNGWYLFGVATKSGFEGNGYASSLINHTIAELQINNYDFIFERPANQQLIDFYLKFGFTELVKKQKHLFPDKLTCFPHADTPTQTSVKTAAKEVLDNIRENFRTRFEWVDPLHLEALITLGEIGRHNELQTPESFTEKCFIAVKPLKNIDSDLFKNAFFCFPME